MRGRRREERKGSGKGDEHRKVTKLAQEGSNTRKRQDKRAGRQNNEKDDVEKRSRRARSRLVSWKTEGLYWLTTTVNGEPR